MKATVYTVGVAISFVTTVDVLECANFGSTMSVKMTARKLRFSAFPSNIEHMQVSPIERVLQSIGRCESMDRKTESPSCRCTRSWCLFDLRTL